MKLSLFFILCCIKLVNVNKYFLLAAPSAITPIPMELLNPRLTEFRRIDSNNDDQISFSEYLQSDRPWMETLSRRYHQLDQNSDGRVTRKEFEQFFRGKEEEHERQRSQADNFFKQLTVTVGPIVERDQVGNASNGASRTHFFSAKARKYATIAHGTGLFPSASSSSSSSSSVEVPSASFDQQQQQQHFPHHSSFFNPGPPPEFVEGHSRSNPLAAAHHLLHHSGQNPFLPSPSIGLGNTQQSFRSAGGLAGQQQPDNSQQQQQMIGGETALAMPAAIMRGALKLPPQGAAMAAPTAADIVNMGDGMQL